MGFVVIDPGHGGKEMGAIGERLFEKDINLNIALKVEQYLTRYGIEVEMTRRNDEDVSLVERVGFANELDPEAFVAIHCNAFNDPAAHGTETWVPNTYDTRKFGASVALGYIVHQHLLVTCNGQDRGIKYKEDESKEFYVLKHTAMPACLVEIDFLTNPEAEARLGEEWFREKAALGIAEGIRRFLEIPTWEGRE